MLLPMRPKINEDFVFWRQLSNSFTWLTGNLVVKVNVRLPFVNGKPNDYKCRVAYLEWRIVRLDGYTNDVSYSGVHRLSSQGTLRNETV